MKSRSTFVSFDHFSLDSRLNAGIQAVGYETPTPIQQQAIPHVLNGRDVLGLAQTGTGKTAAFMLPILQRLTKGPLRQVRALIVAPTRELAEQIHQTAVDLGQKTKIRSTAIYGGVGKNPQLNALKRGVEIVVACPGRLLDLAGEGSIDLSKVEVLVLDEADRMFDMGFLPDVRRIIKLLPTKRQTLLFSATMPDDIRELADSTLKDPATVQIGMIAPAKTVSHAIYPISHKLKKPLLLQMLDQKAMGRVLVFTRTKYRARNLARDLERQGYRTAALQGNMSQNKRQDAIDGFRSGKYDILVATDIAARGIDVADISHVINFDMPDTVDAYTHRIGRTGRAEETGEAFTFAMPDDTAMIRSIEKVLGHRLERQQLAGFNYGEFDPETALQQSGSPQVNGGRSARRDPRPSRNQNRYRSSQRPSRPKARG
ncbi:MAG: DEAD/DEAH box helicase [Ardenticatenaceae bacterium]|nr:DEAD/DEAH box helicase [Ardenticatenaceae bacterium]